jgi:hypothetical protein
MAASTWASNVVAMADMPDEKSAQLKHLVDTLEPGSEKPYGEDELLDEIIDSIPIVPIGFYEEHQDCLRERRFFEAQDFVFNISKGRYHALKKEAKLEVEKIGRQQLLYGRFSYQKGLGPDFGSRQTLPVDFL